MLSETKTLGKSWSEALSPKIEENWKRIILVPDLSLDFSLNA
jgi:hypothetical protein